MRVLFVHGVAEIGGAEQELLRIVDRLPSFGYVPQVVCPSEGPLCHELRRRGIATTFATMVAWRKLGAYPKRARAVKSLRDAIRSSRPSLIHTNDIWWVPQTLRAAEGLGIPVIAHVRQEIEARKVRRYELDHCALAVAVSRNLSA